MSYARKGANNHDEMPAASPRNNEFENFIESLVANFNLKRVS